VTRRLLAVQSRVGGEMSQYLTTVVQTPPELLLRTNVGARMECAVELRAERPLSSDEWDDVFDMLRICRRATDRAAARAESGSVNENPPIHANLNEVPGVFGSREDPDV
jgi:hypothetical protein